MAPIKGRAKGPQKPNRTSAPKTSSAPPKKKGGPPPTQQKTKSSKSMPSKKPRRKQYTAEQLGVPKLNTITPVGVQKPRGKKKGKVFVDDPHTMQTILAIVNAETEGKIESKMLRSRQMEEIREARKKEAEAKEQSRKETLEDKKDEIRQGRKKVNVKAPVAASNMPTAAKKKKKVSFG